jgi:hypothetical protein
VSESIAIPSRIMLSVSEVDPDYVRFDISAGDGRFAGTTEFFASADLPKELAAAMDGFPASPDDRRHIEFGSRDMRAAGGWVSLTGECVDRAAHAVLRVELHDKYAAKGLTPRMSQIYLAVDPPEIDSFVRALRSWDCSLGSTVTLSGQPNGR